MAATMAMSELDDDGLPPRLSLSLTRTETTLDDDEQLQRDVASAKSSDSSVWITRGMTSAQIHETFLSAEHFVSVVLSRLQKDPVSVDPAMWTLQDQTNKLWALKQQALLGSCEESRGTKEYAQAARSAGGSGVREAGGGCLWLPCCFRMMGESKLAAYPYSEDQDDEAADANGVETKQQATTSLTPSSSFLSSATVHSGVLDFFHGSGFRKAWHQYFFVLLIRKGSLGMFLQAQDHVEQKKRPAAVFKLSGYSLRVKSQKRRPHQFRVSHPTKKALQFAATSIAEMNAWITQFTKAIDMANELEAMASLSRATTTKSAVVTSAPLPENDFTQVGNENGNGYDDGENDEE
ncbi:Vacuolar protein sorting-associated protein 27, partial [Globisporangium splendens]